MDVKKVDQCIEDLVADYDRQSGHILKSQIEKLLVKRNLSVEDCTEVYRQLEESGIFFEVDEVDDDSQLLGVEADDDDYNEDVAVEYKNLNARISKISAKLLTADEEIELGRRIELGKRAKDEINSGKHATSLHSRLIRDADKARERMIMANFRLVFHNAKPYISVTDIPLEDLVQEGIMGLMRAVEKFDHTLGYKFSTYATWWIRQSVTRAIADKGATIRLPVHMYESVYKYKKAYRLLQQIKPERNPRISELADELTWSTDKVHFIQQVSTLVATSLDAKLDGYEDIYLIDTLMSDDESPEQYVERLSLVKDIDEALDGLVEREKEILSMRYGLDGYGERMTLEEIGKIYKVTRERIRQIEASALKKLRNHIKVRPDHALSAYMKGE